MKNETSVKLNFSIDLSVWVKICKLAGLKKMEPEALASYFIQKVEATPENFIRKVGAASQKGCRRIASKMSQRFRQQCEMIHGRSFL